MSYCASGVSSKYKTNFSLFLYCLLLNKSKQGQVFKKKYFGLIVMTSQVCWSQNIFHVPRHFLRESSDRENCRTPIDNSGTSNMKLNFSRNISVVTGDYTKAFFDPRTYIMYLRVTQVLSFWRYRSLCSPLQRDASYYVLENVQYNYSVFNQVLLLMLQIKPFLFQICSQGVLPR